MKMHISFSRYFVLYSLVSGVALQGCNTGTASPGHDQSTLGHNKIEPITCGPANQPLTATNAIGCLRRACESISGTHFDEDSVTCLCEAGRAFIAKPNPECIPVQSYWKSPENQSGRDPLERTLYMSFQGKGTDITFWARENAFETLSSGETRPQPELVNYLPPRSNLILFLGKSFLQPFEIEMLTQTVAMEGNMAAPRSEMNPLEPIALYEPDLQNVQEMLRMNSSGRAENATFGTSAAPDFHKSELSKKTPASLVNAIQQAFAVHQVPFVPDKFLTADETVGCLGQCLLYAGKELNSDLAEKPNQEKWIAYKLRKYYFGAPQTSMIQVWNDIEKRVAATILLNPADQISVLFVHNPPHLDRNNDLVVGMALYDRTGRRISEAEEIVIPLIPQMAHEMQNVQNTAVSYSRLAKERRPLVAVCDSDLDPNLAMQAGILDHIVMGPHLASPGTLNGSYWGWTKNSKRHWRSFLDGRYEVEQTGQKTNEEDAALDKRYLPHITMISAAITHSQDNELPKGIDFKFGIVPISGNNCRDAENWVMDYQKIGGTVVNLSSAALASPLTCSDVWNSAISGPLLWVAAAGNNHREVPANQCPTQMIEANGGIVVAAAERASNRADSIRLANYSNYGKNSTDLAAIPECGKNCVAANGTSFAAPVVSRLAATLFYLYPTLSKSDVRYAILSTVEMPIDQNGNLNPLPVRSGGLVHPQDALKMAEFLAKGGAKNRPPLSEEAVFQEYLKIKTKEGVGSAVAEQQWAHLVANGIRYTTQHNR